MMAPEGPELSDTTSRVVLSEPIELPPVDEREPIPWLDRMEWWRRRRATRKPIGTRRRRTRKVWIPIS